MFALLVVGVLLQSLGAYGQTSNATCSVAHKWAFNSQQLSPCQVASALLAVCTGSYHVDLLPVGHHYEGPLREDANPCQCNTVVYSLLAECGLCQNRTISMWMPWETNCATVSINAFPEPIPAGLHVPGWAYLDVKAKDMFDEVAALNADIAESTAGPPPAPTNTSTSSAASATTESIAMSSAAAAAARQRRSNAIGGGVIGAFFFLVLICGLGFWLYHRRKTTRSNGEPLNSPTMSQYRTNTVPSDSRPSNPVPSVTVSTLRSQPRTGSIHSA